MSEIMTRKKDSGTTLSDDDIIAFLKANPQFLNDNPDILDVLAPPRQHSGRGVVDFQQHMIKRARADRDEVLQSTREIVETTRANMNSQARVHTAVLMLLEACSFEDFIHTITMDMATILNVDIISLLVETDGQAVPHISLSGVRAVAPGVIRSVTKDKSTLLEGNIAGFEEIYGGGATLVKSQALVRLSISRDTPDALLAFGSRDPGLFQQGQGTELISFLGKVTERVFRSWLGLPQG